MFPNKNPFCYDLGYSSIMTLVPVDLDVVLFEPLYVPPPRDDVMVDFDAIAQAMFPSPSLAFPSIS